MEEYDELRADYYASLESKSFMSLKDAIAKRKKIDFVATPPAPAPKMLGINVVTKSLEDVVAFIDWNPFFQTWELRGRYPNRGYPKIFNDEKVGAEAKKLFDDAQAMLANIVKTKSLSLKGVVGLFPANTNGTEDVEIYSDETRKDVLATFCMLRQQAEKEADDCYLSQAGELHYKLKIKAKYKNYILHIISYLYRFYCTKVIRNKRLFGYVCCCMFWLRK